MNRATVAPARRLRLPEAATLLGLSVRSLENPSFRLRHRLPEPLRVGRSVGWLEEELSRWLRARTPAKAGGSAAAGIR